MSYPKIQVQGLAHSLLVHCFEKFITALTFSAVYLIIAVSLDKKNTNLTLVKHPFIVGIVFATIVCNTNLLRNVKIFEVKQQK